MDEQLDAKVTKIVPVYDYDKVAGGYFEIYFDFDDYPFKLSFLLFLDHRVNQDQELFEYLKKSAKDSTCSHAIYDLYDIGFPVDEWVEEYIEMAKNSVSMDLFNTFINFYMHLKNFGNDMSGSLE